MQHFMVQWFSGNTILSQIFTVAPISPGANTACYVLGASTLLVNLIVKKIDVNKFKFVKENVNLEFYDPDEKINVIMESVNSLIEKITGLLIDDDVDSDDDYQNADNMEVGQDYANNYNQE